MTMRKKIVAVAAAALTAGAALAVTTNDAEARWRRHGGWGHGGGAIAAGVIGGLALGAIASSAAAAPAYGYGGYGYGGGYGYEPSYAAPAYRPAPVYYYSEPAPYYAAPAPAYGYYLQGYYAPRCRTRREIVRTDASGPIVRRVQICR